MRNLSTASSTRSGSTKYSSKNHDTHKEVYNNRNYPSFLLQGHGLSKTTIKRLRPLPEKAEESSSHAHHPHLPPYFQRPHSLSLSSNDSSQDDKLSLSDASSLSTVRSNSSFGSIRSVSTLENMSTGRSSVYSWGNDDEFDKQATNKVLGIFENIDDCLFENNQKDNEALKEECYAWKTSFPFLRVVGLQVAPESEDGTQIILNTESGSRNSNNVTSSLSKSGVHETFESYSAINLDIGNLILSGHKVEVMDSTQESTDSNSFSHLSEEIFAEHGHLEEFLAFDEKSIETDRDYKESKRRAYPPITPQAFARDVALSECFDHVWAQIVKILSDLLKLYIKTRKNQKENQSFRYGAVIDRFLKSALNLTASSRDSYKMAPKLQSQIRMKPAMNDAKELMTIRSISLKPRAPSVNNNLLRGDEECQSSIGTSSSTIVTQKQSVRADTMNLDRMMSAKTPKRTIRLPPLPPPKTAGHVDVNIGEIRETPLSNLSSVSNNEQQLWGPQNLTLPPLDRLGTVVATTKEIRNKSPKKNNRSSSAVSAHSKHSSERDRDMTYHAMLPDSRPNTNHSYRSDIATPLHFPPLPYRSRGPNIALHGHTHYPQTIDENSNLCISNSLRNDVQPQEFEDFTLRGQALPLISPQQRKGKTVGKNSNAR